MTPQTFWRNLALCALLGWALTAAGWILSSPSSAEPTHEAREHSRQARSMDAPQKQRRSRQPHRPSPPLSPINGAVASSRDVDVDHLREEIRGELLDELHEERASHHRRRSEQHLNRLLDDVATLAADLELTEAASASVEAAVTAMHEDLEAMRPQGPPPPGGPSADDMIAIRESFDTFQEEVRQAVPEDEVASEFIERMTPPPLRERR